MKIEIPPKISYENGRYLFENVPYRGKIYRRVELLEQLASGMSRDSLSNFYEKRKCEGGPVPLDLPMVLSLFNTGRIIDEQDRDRIIGGQNRDRTILEKFRNFGRCTLRSYCPSTLTSIKLNKFDGDAGKIIHNVGTSDQYELEGKICRYKLDNCHFDYGIKNNSIEEKFLKNLTNLSPFDLKASLRWINNNLFSEDVFVSMSSSSQDEHVVGFLTYIHWNGLVDRDPMKRFPAFQGNIRE